jgi:hypothetical protein
MERSQGEPDTDAVRAELRVSNGRILTPYPLGSARWQGSIFGPVLTLRAWLAEHLTPEVVEAAERLPPPTT